MSSPITLSHSPAKIVQYLLIAGGQGTVPATTPAGVQNNWPVFAQRKVVNTASKDSYPTNAVFVFNPAGILDGRSMRTGQETEHYGICIHTRDLDPEVAYVKANNIKDWLLQNVYQQSVTVPEETSAEGNVIPGATYTIQALTQTTSVVGLGPETQARWSTFSVNFTVTFWRYR
jgi:hypothetical protein